MQQQHRQTQTNPTAAPGFVCAGAAFAALHSYELSADLFLL
jgi:hypothetical protein